MQILREGNPTEARVAVDRLIGLGGQSVPPLKDMLDDLKAAGRWPQALTALEKIGPPASDAMDVAAKRLTSDNPAVRIGVVKYLAAMGFPARRHIPAMIRAADSNNPSVKQACEKSIVKLGPFGKSDQTLILGEGEDKDPNVRGLRARLLVEMDLPQAEKVRLMDPFFKDKHPIVRADAARAVCKPDKFPRADVYRHVVPFLGDTDNSVRSAARTRSITSAASKSPTWIGLRPFFASESAEVHYYLSSECGRSANGRRHCPRTQQVAELPERRSEIRGDPNRPCYKSRSPAPDKRLHRPLSPRQAELPLVRRAMSQTNRQGRTGCSKAQCSND